MMNSTQQVGLLYTQRIFYNSLLSISSTPFKICFAAVSRSPISTLFFVLRASISASVTVSFANAAINTEEEAPHAMVTTSRT